MKVVKFGGSSLADAGQIRKTIDIVKADSDRRLVVVSAPGKRDSDDTKVTDLLILLGEAVLAERSFDQELAAVVARYAAIQQALQLNPAVVAEIEEDLRRRVANRSSHDARFMDAIKAAGEDSHAKVMALAFAAQGISARYVNPKEAGLLLSDDFGNAQVLPESLERLASLRETEEIVIFPGFFGYTPQGDIVTFPRGGSDITGAILAAAVKADVYENFTDVDSVYAMDPRLVADAPSIEILTYREMRELAYAGFGVFHDEAIVPAIRANVPICIKNTNCPEAPGTLIVPQRPYKHGEVTGIASAEGFSAISLSKYMMNREVGFGRRLLQIVEEEGLSFEHAPSGIDNMSVIIKSEPLAGVKEKHVLARIQDELEPDELSVEHGLSLIMIVGEGMRYAVGVAAKACAALSQAGVNIELINQGSSEISIMFGVKEVDRKKAVQALGRALF